MLPRVSAVGNTESLHRDGGVRWYSITLWSKALLCTTNPWQGNNLSARLGAEILVVFVIIASPSLWVGKLLLWPKSGPLLVFVNKGLLEYSYTHYMYIQLLLCCSDSNELLWQRPHGLESRKYLVFGSLGKELMPACFHWYTQWKFLELLIWGYKRWKPKTDSWIMSDYFTWWSLQLNWQALLSAAVTCQAGEECFLLGDFRAQEWEKVLPAFVSLWNGDSGWKGTATRE